MVCRIVCVSVGFVEVLVLGIRWWFVMVMNRVCMFLGIICVCFSSSVCVLVVCSRVRFVCGDRLMCILVCCWLWVSSVCMYLISVLLVCIWFMVLCSVCMLVLFSWVVVWVIRWWWLVLCSSLCFDFGLG